MGKVDVNTFIDLMIWVAGGIVIAELEDLLAVLIVLQTTVTILKLPKLF
jgi:hypothetical protein